MLKWLKPASVSASTQLLSAQVAKSFATQTALVVSVVACPPFRFQPSRIANEYEDVKADAIQVSQVIKCKFSSLKFVKEFQCFLS